MKTRIELLEAKIIYLQRMLVISKANQTVLESDLKILQMDIREQMKQLKEVMEIGK